MHRNSSPISVLNAEVSTVSVEIKTLTIGRKQVTLAVFRQLRYGEPINLATNTFNGLPWGTVNYHPSSRCDPYLTGEHLHVVWQQGSELRSAVVAPGEGGQINGRYPDPIEAELKKVNNGIERIEYRLQFADKAIDPTVSESERWQARQHAAEALGLEKRPLYFEGCRDCFGQHAPGKPHRQMDVTPALVRGLHEKINQQTAELRKQQTVLNQELVAANKAVAASMKAYDARYAELQALPQLFIAV